MEQQRDDERHDWRHDQDIRNGDGQVQRNAFEFGEEEARCKPVEDLAAAESARKEGDAEHQRVQPM